MVLKEFYKDVDGEIDDILNENFEIEKARVIPEVTQLSYNNEGKLVDASVLYVDMRGSTDLTDSFRQTTVAKIYKCFLNEMIRAARYKGGKIRGFAGDRIMVLFDGERPCSNAVETALIMQNIVKYVLNPKLIRKFRDRISCGIGIDFGRMLIARVGMMRDPNNNDLVWLGQPANYASKFADQAKGGEIIISRQIYNGMYPMLKYPTSAWPANNGWSRSLIRVNGKPVIVHKNTKPYNKEAQENSLNTEEILKSLLPGLFGARKT